MTLINILHQHNLCHHMQTWNWIDLFVITNIEPVLQPRCVITYNVKVKCIKSTSPFSGFLFSDEINLDAFLYLCWICFTFQRTVYICVSNVIDLFWCDCGGCVEIPMAIIFFIKKFQICNINGMLLLCYLTKLFKLII